MNSNRGIQTACEYPGPEQLLRGSEKELIATAALLVFMLSDGICYVLEMFLPASFTEKKLDHVLITLILAGLLAAYYVLYFSQKKKKLQVWPAYILAAVFMGVTLIFHPEYGEWYRNDTYGIRNSFLLLTRGIYTLLFFSLFRDNKRLLGTIILAAELNFLMNAALFVYVQAARGGVWTVINGSGDRVNTRYNLTYGYNVAFSCVTGLLMAAFGKKKLTGFIMFAVSFLLIILAGSRGALICPAVAVGLCAAVKIKEMKNPAARAAVLFLIALAVLLVLVFGISGIASGLMKIFRLLNISSRNIEKLLDGSITDDNGRSVIWGLAKDMLAEKRLLGFGFYGDRYYIGQTWSYGYPHNIFYEMAIEFGVPAAVIILGAIAGLSGYTLVRCREKEAVFLLILMFSCSMKLLVSDSFWYNSSFWGLLYILLYRLAGAFHAKRNTAAGQIPLSGG